MSIIKSLKKDDNAAFSEAFNEYHNALYSYIIKKTQSDYIAEEVVQLTFFKLWKYRQSLKEDIPLLNQLFRIARTTLINELKKEQYANQFKEFKRHSSKNEYEHIIEQISYTETLTKLGELVNILPPVRKKVFELSRFKYMTNKEISEHLSISPKTVENHMTLALKFIKPFFVSNNIE